MSNELLAAIAKWVYEQPDEALRQLWMWYEAWDEWGVLNIRIGHDGEPTRVKSPGNLHIETIVLLTERYFMAKGDRPEAGGSSSSSSPSS